MYNDIDLWTLLLLLQQLFLSKYERESADDVVILITNVLSRKVLYLCKYDIYIYI